MSQLMRAVLATAMLAGIAGAQAGETANRQDLNGFRKNGLDQNGFRKNGLDQNGIRKNGVQLNRIAFNGTELPRQLNGVPLNGVGIR